MTSLAVLAAVAAPAPIETSVVEAAEEPAPVTLFFHLAKIDPLAFLDNQEGRPASTLERFVPEIWRNRRKKAPLNVFGMVHESHEEKQARRG